MEQEETPDWEKMSLPEISEWQSRKIGDLLDLGQALVADQRHSANQWYGFAVAHRHQAMIAEDIAESCAVAARMSADRVGDLISAEYGLIEIEDDVDDSDDDDHS